LTFGRLRQRFPVCDLWLAGRRLDVEFIFQPINDRRKLQLVDPTNRRLAGLRVAVDPESRVFGQQLPQSLSEFLLVGIGRWLDHHENDLRRSIHWVMNQSVMV